MFSSLRFNPYCTTENVLTEADWGKPDRRTISSIWSTNTKLWAQCEPEIGTIFREGVKCFLIFRRSTERYFLFKRIHTACRMDGILNINGTTRNKRESAFFPTHIGSFETQHVSSFLNQNLTVILKENREEIFITYWLFNYFSFHEFVTCSIIFGVSM